MRAPEPGFYEGVSEPIYRSWPYVSQSHLKTLAHRTPAHAYYALTHPSEQTDEQALGVAAHMAVLEPERFERTYISAPPGLARNKKEAAQVWQARGFEWGDRKWNYRGPQEVLTYDDFQAVLGIQKALFADATAADLLLGQGKNEVSIVWDEFLADGTGPIRCKARLDRLTLVNRWPTAIDLKSTKDAARFAARWDIGKYRYYVQDSMYRRALAAMDELAARPVVKRHFVFLFVESKAPHLSAAYRLDEASAYEADRQTDDLLARFAAHQESGVWPGYPPGVHEVDLPEQFWARRD